MATEMAGSPGAEARGPFPAVQSVGPDLSALRARRKRARSSLIKTLWGNGDAERDWGLTRLCHLWVTLGKPVTLSGILSLPVCKTGRCYLADCEGHSSRATPPSPGAGCAGSLTARSSGEKGDHRGEWPGATEAGSDPLPPTPFPARRNPLHLPLGGEKTRERTLGMGSGRSAPGGRRKTRAGSRAGAEHAAPSPCSARAAGGWEGVSCLARLRRRGRAGPGGPPGAPGLGVGARGLRSGARVTCEEGRKSRKAGRRAASWEFSARRGRRELGLPGKPGTRQRRGPGSETAGAAPRVGGRERDRGRDRSETETRRGETGQG